METRPQPEVIVCGLNVVDVLFVPPPGARKDHKHQVEQLVIQGGAPAGNAACLLASLGWRTGFVGHFGDNTLSLIARSELERFGIVPDFFKETSGAKPAVAVVEVDGTTGERTVYYTLEGYRFVKRGEVPVDAIRTAKLLLVDGYEPEAAIAALEAARDAGVRSVLDIEAGDEAVLVEMLRLGTDVILPLEAARRLSGCEDPEGSLRALSSMSDAQLLVTDGLRGSWALADGGVIHQPAFMVDAVDTTGCGDAYHGAYASALLDGWALPLRMEFASWVASQVALGFGGRANFPSRAGLGACEHSGMSAGLAEVLTKTTS